MDNAVKAMIMAATVVLGIMLLSLLVYTFRAAAKVDEQYESNQSARSIELHNSKFEKYYTYDNTIMDLIDLCGLAYSNNVNCDYDQNLAIEIDIDIGGNIYKIPSSFSESSREPMTAYKAAQLNITNSLPDGYGKNRIWLGNDMISIYDLVNKSAKELGISSAKEGERLTKTHTGLVQYTRHNDRTGVDETITENITVYKYYFKCTHIEYNDVTHKVKLMTFTRTTNNDLPFKDSDVRAWDPDWD